MDFKKIKKAVQVQFELMKGHELFRVQVEGDKLYETYLSAFPEGTNPMFRERTEHDCSCCRSFIKSIGGIVAIVNGQLMTIWDVTVGDGYQPVVDALSALVKAAAIENVFLHIDNKVGTDKNFEEIDGKSKTWEHFYVQLPAKLVIKKADLGTKLGDTRTTKEMLLRALTEITDDAIETTLDLTAQGSLYRGDEKKALVVEFQKLKVKFAKLTTDAAKDLFCWSQSRLVNPGVSRIRNDAIGTLLVNLSEGMDLEVAVKKWESIMAPTNYQRPTALITKAQIEKANAAITDAGLKPALERRPANIRDIKITDVIWADRNAKRAINGDVFDDLMSATPTGKGKSFDKVEEISIEDFLTNVLPNAQSVELMFDGRLTGNLTSLIAPVHADAKNLFKWDNPFSWSYAGEVADSIKERVKNAGGTVTGDLCCRLAWYNHDDLDFHMKEGGQYEIEFHNKGRLSPNGGMLDVDMNAGGGTTRTPVENIFYTDRRQMREQVYTLEVHNFAKRENTNVGFEVQIEMNGVIHNITYANAVPNGKTITVAKIKYSLKNGFEIIESLPSSQSVKEVWGINTQNFHRVSAVMLSPNFWGKNEVGNKQFFFMLDGCKNAEKARGFYNEMLSPELAPHRKVMEIVGSKMMAEDADDQLAGLGFSSTTRNEVIVKVTGSFTRTLKVKF